MSAVNEAVVREYFEVMGFLTSQPNKYTAVGRHRKAEEEFDLIVVNPQALAHKVSPHMIWSTPDLKTVSRAIIGVRGWHTGRFSSATFEQMPEILRFAEPASVRAAVTRLGAGPMAKILCLPKLPASGLLKEETLKFLKQKGIDGVLPFQTILMELIQSVNANLHYEKSDLLQILRMLKTYDLLKDGQMELFGGRRRSAGRRAGKQA